jgi:hypothetical protein
MMEDGIPIQAVVQTRHETLLGLLLIGRQEEGKQI